MIGSLQYDPAKMSPEDVDARIADRVSGQLRYCDGTTLRGWFQSRNILRESVSNEQRVITRDAPLFVV